MAMTKYRCAGRRRKLDDGTMFCDYEAERPWTGFCPACGRLYDVLRQGPGDQDRAKVSLASLADLKPPERILTGCPEFDRVLGGGLVPGSTVIITGAPGAGKSTLLLATSDGVAKAKEANTVLYTSGEQNRDDIGMMAVRLNCLNPKVAVMGNEGDVYRIVEEAASQKPTLLIVDSLQTCITEDAGGDAGSAEQLMAATNYLTSFGKTEKIAIILVCHVNKDGDMAGPKKVEHLVDTVVYLNPYNPFEDVDPEDEGALDKLSRIPAEELAILRMLEIGKNRNGPPGIREVVELSPTGIKSASRRVSKLFLVP